MEAKTKKRINSRAKGARGEREWAAMLSKYGFESRRGAQNGVRDGLDVQGDIPGWRGEVKSCAKAEWSSWWRQAQDAAERARSLTLAPYVAWRPPRKPWRVRTISSQVWGPSAGDVMIEMDGEEFLRIMRAKWEAREARLSRHVAAIS